MSLSIFIEGARTSSWWIGIAPRTDFAIASHPAFQVGSLAAILSTTGCIWALVGFRIVSGIPN
jgi:hypothetical protein